MFGNKAPSNSVSEAEVTARAQKNHEREVERRAWCIAEAVYLDDANQINVISIAEKIYEYVYGARE